jgi:hypothetical protein
MSKLRAMRGFLASSIGVTCAGALALPLTPPAATAAAKPALTAEAVTSAAGRTVGQTAGRAAGRASEQYAPGSTQSLRLGPLTGDRTRGRAVSGTAEQGLLRRDVRHFSLVGVVWDDPDTELHGRVQVRTRTAATGDWSGWQDLETHNADHGADPDTAERTSGHVRGATAPLWVGDSDGVEVRVRAEADGEGGAQSRAGGGVPAAPAASGVPSGLRLELVDPGEAAPPPNAPMNGPRTGALGGAEALGAAEIRALNRQETQQELLTLRAGELTAQQKAQPYIGPRPRIVTRRGWGANESLREKTFVYTKKVKAAFVHHTASGNNYTCSQAPSLIRSIYRYHVKSMGWRDIGYNFLVDKCGNIYEGRAGGVAKPVMGAHTLGFNSNSMGVRLQEAVVRRCQGHRPAHRVEARPVRDESTREDIPEVRWWQSLPKR